MTTVLEIFVLILAGYIIYLHILLARKEIRIHSLVVRLNEIEKTIRLDEMRKERLFDDECISFLLGNEKDSRIFVHYTMDENDARNIISEGFRFTDSFYKTALQVTSDRLDLLVKHNDKRYFGDYIIVICINNEIIRKYNEKLAKAGIRNTSFENILTIIPPVKNENSDMEYLLPGQYVKGYLNHRTGEIVSNHAFDPLFVSQVFEDNIRNKSELLK
ncbi:MAG: hypothetical protein U0X39_05215 [Bacteroidales bacterium]